MPRPKRKLPEPIECDPVAMADLEAVAQVILNAPMPEGQHRENREPTQTELKQKFKLERRP